MTAPWSWSPLTVFVLTLSWASPIVTSPEAVVMLIAPRTTSSSTSPDAVWTLIATGHLTGCHVAARALHVDAAEDAVDLDVAGRGLHGEPADRAARDQVGRLALDVHERSLGAADAAGDSAPSEDEAEAEAAAPERDVDDHVRPVGMLLELHPRLVDRVLRLLVVGGQLDLDPAFQAGIDLDLAGREPELELDGTGNLECPLHLRDLLALGVAGQTFAAGVGWARLRRARDRTHEPRIGRDSLARGGLLDRRLQGLGQAQADPRRELLAGAGGLAPGRVDEHELGLLAGEAHLDVAGGQLRRKLQCGLRKEVEQLQPQV